MGIKGHYWKDNPHNRVNHISDKGLVRILNKSSLTYNSFVEWQKMGKRFEQPFLQRRYTNGSKDMKRCSVSLVTREVQIKITVRCHFIPLAWLQSNQLTIKKMRLEKIGIFTSCWWESKIWCSCLRKQFGNFSISLNNYHMNQH